MSGAQPVDGLFSDIRTIVEGRELFSEMKDSINNEELDSKDQENKQELRYDFSDINAFAITMFFINQVNSGQNKLRQPNL